MYIYQEREREGEIEREKEREIYGYLPACVGCHIYTKREREKQR